MKKPFVNLTEIENNFSTLYGENIQGQKERYENLFELFKKQFDVNCAYFASSSGRVELCGNHTDHNGGRVLTCAISLDALCAFLPRDDQKIYIKSEGYDDIDLDINDFKMIDYPMDEIKKKNPQVKFPLAI